MSNDNRSRDSFQNLVHKHVADEVFVTEVTETGDGWLIGGRLPVHHAFHNDTAGRQSGYYDPLLVLEAFRQGCIAASHLFYSVPHDVRRTVRHYEFAVLDFHGLEIGTEPAEFEFHTEIRREFQAGGRGPVSGLALAMVARRNGIDAMEISGSFGWMSEARWQQLRTGASREPMRNPPATDPLSVCRRELAHVVIGDPVRRHDDGSVSAPIRADVDSPTFFDHPLDHLPGSLILEVFRQLALVGLGPRALAVAGPSRLRCEFHSIAEFNPVCIATVVPVEGGLAFRGDVTQDGQCRATAELAFAAEEFTQ